MDDILKSEWYIELEKLDKERRKTLKSGDNVIHLEYLGGLIDEDTIIEIEENLKTANLELSRYNYSGFPQASLEEFISTIFIAIQKPIVLSILSGVAANIVWESIKFAVKKIRRKLKHKTYTKLTSRTKESKNVSFGLKFKLNEKTRFSFKISGDISEEVLDSSLDKIIGILKQHDPNEVSPHDYYLTFNEKDDLWEKVNVQEEIRKGIAKKTK